MSVQASWLFIDTHLPGRFRLGWLSLSGHVQARTFSSRPASLMRHLFTHESVALLACRGVCVVEGPGPFSAIRTGVLYANLIARLFKLPLIKVTATEALDLNQLVGTLTTRPPLTYVAPVYDREPNITLPLV